MPRRIFSGPIQADVMVIGDFPQEADFQSGEPFSDYNQSSVLTKAFSAMKLAQTASFRTYVSTIPEPEDEKTKLLSPNKKCPNPTWEHENGYWVSPQLAQDKRELLELIERVQPKIIIACGLLALWATTGYDAPSKWRGSRLSPPGRPCPVVPTLSLLAPVTQSEMLPVILMDFRRARNIYDGTQLPRHYRFELAPTFGQVLARLDWLLAKADSGPTRLSGDLETRVGHIACFGIAWSAEEAICIPHLIIPPQSTFNWSRINKKTGELELAPKFDESGFDEVLGHHLWHMQRFPEAHFYWTVEEEAEILVRIQALFVHPFVTWVGQNYLYDCQYFGRHWGFLPVKVFDTMIGHHSIYSNMRKGLDFLSSMYAQDHVYWKDESKDWDPKIGERQYWAYNCLALDTPVLMADSSYKPLADVAIGDRVFTFEETPSGHRYARVGKVAIVTKTAKALKEASRYAFSDGTHIDATPDHKILTTRGADSRSSWQWREFRDLTLGDKVSSFGKPWRPDNTFDGGWLSGIFDGEGTVGFLNMNKSYAPYPRIGFSQKPGPVLDRALELLANAGYSVRLSPKPSATYVDINGGLTEQMRLLGQFRPLRIGKNFHKYSYCEGVSGFSGLARPHLVSITPLGTVPVGDISTTEGTFIAGGIFVHNCKDACITWEITDPILESQKDRAVSAHCEFQQALFFPVLRMMDRGIRYNKQLRGTWDPIMETGTGLKGELVNLQIARQRDLDYAAGHPLNANSPAQLSRFLYEDLKIPGVKNLTGDSLTTNSPAMALIAERVPALRKLCQLIVELRSLQVFLSTFIDAKLDIDDRMRCSFGIAGPETYRFNSRENAFGSGMNLQNIPMSEKQKIKAEDYIKLPNIRKLFLPDPGYVFFDMDLDRADLQVVVWEADDTNLKKVLRLGLDIHCVNACDIFKIKGIPYEELSESHPNYKNHRGKIGEAKRGKAKAGVHATDYGVGDRKLAMALGITVFEASEFRKNWFAAHPGILRWHKRVEQEGTRRGYIENRFGARLYTLGRFDLPVALGWGPQSTVAGVINRALVAIDKAEQEGRISAKLLLQVHDSLGGQIRADRLAEDVPYLQQLAAIPIPYSDPLIIPTSVNISPLSWGDCK